jgi:hypothetical protein
MNTRSRIEWRAVRSSASVSQAAAEAPPRGAVPAVRRRSLVEESILASGIPRTSEAQTPREDAIGLLQLAAEVEHELLVEYLYAAASIDTTAGLDSKAARRTITTIAIQEMGHLVAVQNLLLAIGGRDAHHLGRDGIRERSERNPLPFILEPLRHATLAKYVTVESPEQISDPTVQDRVDKLRKEAEADAQFTPHPVVALYAAIYWLFQPSDQPFGPFPLEHTHFVHNWHLKSPDFVDAATIDRFGSTANEWAGFPGLTIALVHGAVEGCVLLSDVMVQGEGAAGGTGESHFTKFLSVLDSLEGNRVAILPLPRTPRVADQPPSEDPHATVLTHPYTDRWGRLFNLRYTHLVLTIGHTLFLPVDDPDRDALSKLALTMMRPGLSALIQQMTRLTVDVSASAKAAPPFGLLDDTLPSDLAAFWARHKTVMNDEASSVAVIKSSPEFAKDATGQLLLQQLVNVDQPLIELLAART